MKRIRSKCITMITNGETLYNREVFNETSIYDEHSNEVINIDENGNRIEHLYSKAGKPLMGIDIDKGISTYIREYDKNDREVLHKIGEKVVCKTAYDTNDKGHLVATSYDYMNNKIVKVYYKNKLISYNNETRGYGYTIIYDNEGKEIIKKFNDGSSVIKSYNEIGKIDKVVNDRLDNDVIYYKYNELGLLESRLYTLTNIETKYSYDNKKRVLKIIYNSSDYTDYKYDDDTRTVIIIRHYKDEVKTEVLRYNDNWDLIENIKSDSNIVLYAYEYYPKGPTCTKCVFGCKNVDCSFNVTKMCKNNNGRFLHCHEYME